MTFTTHNKFNTNPFASKLDQFGHGSNKNIDTN